MSHKTAQQHTYQLNYRDIYEHGASYYAEVFEKIDDKEAIRFSKGFIKARKRSGVVSRENAKLIDCKIEELVVISVRRVWPPKKSKRPN